jgi:hypothetical protein
MGRLLILACSKKKKSAIGTLPAIERYDGPAFRVLRKFLRERPDDPLTVLILSAKYGLIDAARRISDYDRRLSTSRAEVLHRQVLSEARTIMDSVRWDAVGVCAGKEYRIALQSLLALVPKGTRIDVLGGGLGQRLTYLRAWLRCPTGEEATTARA